MRAFPKGLQLVITISVKLSDSCEKEFRNIGIKLNIEANKIHRLFLGFDFCDRVVEYKILCSGIIQGVS